MARNPNWRNVIRTERAADRNGYLWRRLQLPNLFKTYSKHHPHAAGKLRGITKMKQFIEKLKQVEADLTAWEEANPELHKELPWYEAREEYKRQKAEGTLVEQPWWEIMGKLNHLGDMSNGSPKPGHKMGGNRRKKKVPEPSSKG